MRLPARSEISCSLLGFIVVLTCSAGCAAAMTLTATTVPVFGVAPPQSLAGTVTDLGSRSPDSLRVLCFVYTSLWYSKEGSAVAADGSFSCPLVIVPTDSLSRLFAAYVVPQASSYPTANDDKYLPESLKAIALAGGVIQPGGAPLSLSFGGFWWEVRNDTGGPGPNIFASSQVSISSTSGLTMRLTPSPAGVLCSEVILVPVFKSNLGYGTFVFRVSTDFTVADWNGVLGLFTYEGAGTAPAPNPHRELDIELSSWGRDIASSPNAQFVAQPAVATADLDRFAQQGPVPESTWVLNWVRPGLVRFKVYRGALASSAFSADALLREFAIESPSVPDFGSARIHMNFWLYRGDPSLPGLNNTHDGLAHSYVISGFEYLAAPLPTSSLGVGLAALSPLALALLALAAAACALQ